MECIYPDYIILGDKPVYLDEDYNYDLMNTINLVYSKNTFWVFELKIHGSRNRVQEEYGPN